jgi:hypothetical protein
VVRLAEGGSLEGALRGGGGPPAPLPPAAARRVALGVARGLAYLHSRPDPVVHNDLKSGNVLLDGKGNALLADFGLSRALRRTLCHTHGSTLRGGELGTIGWMAPENGDDESPHYGKPPADMYSFAMLLFELVTGREPWDGRNLGQIALAVSQGRRPAVPAGLDAELVGLMAACWAQEPAARPSAAVVVARLVAMEWGRSGGERAAPGTAWAEKLRAWRAAAGADGAPTPPPATPPLPAAPPSVQPQVRAAELPTADMPPARAAQLMKAGAEDARVVGAEATTLQAITARGEIEQVACVAAGTIPLLVCALTRHAGEAAVCQNASGALWNISITSDAHRDACVAAGAIPALVGALTRHAGEAAVCKNASGTLQGITATRDTHRVACVAAGAISLLVGALTRHAGEAAVCQNASGALWNILITSDAHRDACVAAGAIPALVGALTRHAGEADVCKNASGALHSLVLSPAHRCAVVAAGAVPRLAAAWSVHPSAKASAHGALEKLGFAL